MCPLLAVFFFLIKIAVEQVECHNVKEHLFFINFCLNGSNESRESWVESNRQ